MKVTCDREQLLAAFQTAAAVAPARSPKPILQNVKLEVSENSAIILATDLEVGVRTVVSGVDVQVAGAAVLPVARFGSILRESSDEQLRIETDGQATLVRGERSEFRLPAENPHEFPAVAEFTEAKYHQLPARLAQGADPPHGLRHRQREQPLRPGGRAAGILRRQDHRRGHRRPPAGQDGSAGPKRRRPRLGRRHDDRADQGHATDRADADRSATPRFRSPPAATTCW